MCGRYQRRSDKQRIAEAFALGNDDGLSSELAPDYNVAPHTMQPAIVWDEQFGTRRLHMMLWRFLPRFVMNPKTFTRPTINAKGETLLKNHIWRESFMTRRCLIPADSFLQWLKEDGQQLPYVFAMRDNSPFGFGGVWCRWWSPQRRRGLDTFAIITVESNELVAEKTGHDRMPLIVARKDRRRWLGPGDPAQPPVHLLRPFDSTLMKAWRADQRINDVKNNDPAVGEPLREAEGNAQFGMFRATPKQS